MASQKIFYKISKVIGYIAYILITLKEIKIVNNNTAINPRENI